MSDYAFKIGERVVYSSHGVGEIVDIKVECIADQKVEMYVVQVNDSSQDGMRVSVPIYQEGGCVLRALIKEEDIGKVISVLKEKSKRVSSVVWNRRVNEYKLKKSEGDLISLSEVVRDLHVFIKNNNNVSSSERAVYKECLGRIITELSLVMSLSEAVVQTEIVNILDGLQDSIRRSAPAHKNHEDSDHEDDCESLSSTSDSGKDIHSRREEELTTV